jgi:glucose/arabinose dehydrogenase
MKYFAVPDRAFTIGLLTFLLLILTFTLLNLIPVEISAYPTVASKCDTDPCVEPTVIDHSLKVQQVANGLNAPTKMAFVDSKDILVLERYTGKIMRITNNTIQPEPILDVNVAAGAGERGLLGIAVSKETEHTYIFVYYTESQSDGGVPIGNRLYRYELVNDKLMDRKLLLNLPFAPGPYHNGGAITIGPDQNVYLTIGDLDNVDDKPRPASKVQNAEGGSEPNGSGGILRVAQNGGVVEAILGNNYPLNLYYGYGLRNSFGIDFDPITGKLWDTENGPNYGDEINLVEPGFNGGWTKVQGVWLLKGSNIGKEIDSNLTRLELEDFNGKGKFSLPEFTWKGRYGPTGLKFLGSDKLGKQYENDLFVGDVHNGTVYHFDLNKERTELSLNGSLSDKIANSTQELKDVIFGKGFGGITDLQLGDDGFLYVVSYGHGSIYRIMPSKGT